MKAQKIEDRHKYNTVQHEGEYDEYKSRDDTRLLRFDPLNDGLDAEHYCEDIEHCY